MGYERPETLNARRRRRYQFARGLGFCGVEAQALSVRSEEAIQALHTSGDRSFMKRRRRQQNIRVGRFQAKHPDRIYARQCVKVALIGGHLLKLPCEVCGDEAVEGHHADYSKVLQVTWLCPTHHQTLHRH